MTKQLPVVTCATESGTTPEEVERSHLYVQWLSTFLRYGRKITLYGVHVVAAHKWGVPLEIKMMHVKAEAYGPDGERLDGIALLRGDTVDVLTVVRCEGRDYAILVAQPRVAGAQWRVLSNPSGMVDHGEGAVAAALRELDEELGGVGHIHWHPLVNLSAEVLGTGHGEGMLVSPGGSDEVVHFGLLRAEVTPDQLDALSDKHGGLQEEGERVQLLVVPIEDALTALPQGGRADVKTALSLLLYDKYLNRASL